ncbi:hypothetical protein JX265_006284 [Neoarthrinium moseri]|uniref:Uncharacterized protein n=1 Tax=Neoarthrinium moseri TaxID=1658444 RepID=A0A9P9WMC0_9PEZI|nr:hypothetical protein JX265_006284 [Neoarthrinium moseri]
MMFALGIGRLLANKSNPGSKEDGREQSTLKPAPRSDAEQSNQRKNTDKHVKRSRPIDIPKSPMVLETPRQLFEQGSVQVYQQYIDIFGWNTPFDALYGDLSGVRNYHPHELAQCLHGQRPYAFRPCEQLRGPESFQQRRRLGRARDKPIRVTGSHNSVGLRQRPASAPSFKAAQNQKGKSSDRHHNDVSHRRQSTHHPRQWHSYKHFAPHRPHIKKHESGLHHRINRRVKPVAGLHHPNLDDFTFGRTRKPKHEPHRGDTGEPVKGHDHGLDTPEPQRSPSTQNVNFQTEECIFEMSDDETMLQPKFDQSSRSDWQPELGAKSLSYNKGHRRAQLRHIRLDSADCAIESSSNSDDNPRRRVKHGRRAPDYQTQRRHVPREPTIEEHEEVNSFLNKLSFNNHNKQQAKPNTHQDAPTDVNRIPRHRHVVRKQQASVHRYLAVAHQQLAIAQPEFVPDFEMTDEARLDAQVVETNEARAKLQRLVKLARKTKELPGFRQAEPLPERYHQAPSQWELDEKVAASTF